MCAVADDHSFLIGCKSAQTAPGSSGSLKVPGQINPISVNPLGRLVWIKINCVQLAGTWSLVAPEVHTDHLFWANRCPIHCCLFCSTSVMFNTSGQIRERWGCNDECDKVNDPKICVSFCNTKQFTALISDSQCCKNSSKNPQISLFSACSFSAHEIYLFSHNSQLSQRSSCQDLPSAPLSTPNAASRDPLKEHVYPI